MVLVVFVCPYSRPAEPLSLCILREVFNLSCVSLRSLAPVEKILVYFAEKLYTKTGGFTLREVRNG